ncbi:MAG TPA: SdrD B-like domain-containing protein [Candidatus Saccharimonadales bacterium]|nr:SdrD B-like domain-containing protein [Candidatus Saccharimonadales bacterium]
MLRYLRTTLVAAVMVVGATLLFTSNTTHAAGHVGSSVCPPTGAPTLFGRANCDGYFTGVDQYNNGININDVINDGPGSPSLLSVNNVDDFVLKVKNALNGSDQNDKTGAAFLIETMLGKQGTDFTTISGGITQAQSDFAFWEKLVRHYDAMGDVSWNPNNTNTTLDAGFINSGISAGGNNDAVFFIDPDTKLRPMIKFTNPDGTQYWVDKNCANPTGLDPNDLKPLYAKVSIGNYVWFDANNDGIVNGKDATSGINGVNMALYTNAADANGDGTLDATELAAATPTATKKTADDPRTGSTKGRDGYYRFTDLDPGKYFVCVMPTNFAAGGVLEGTTASPVPTGVADTQSDNKSHGLVPAGGTQNANGVCSTAINLQLFQEPTTSDSNKDDDKDDTSDFTIDFGVWHPYSLGNRVWCDTNNSATIDSGDGASPCGSLGVANVKVNLMDCDGNQLASTTTDANGYYRFDNLNADCYKVQIDPSNFQSGGPLAACGIPSSGAGLETDPNKNVDNNSNGITQNGMVMSNAVNIGPKGVEPTAEADLAPDGQGTDDPYANMTVDFGFTCTLPKTGEALTPLLATAAAVVIGGGSLMAVRKFIPQNGRI